MLRPVMTTMRKVRLIAASIDGSDVNGGTLTTNGIEGAKQHLKISETGNGAYTITLNEPGSMPCFAIATPVTDNSIVYIGACTASTVLVTQETASTGAALADADFNIVIFASDAEDET
jgi:hypothetical protein